MGFESITYRYLPGKVGKEKLVEALQNCGAVRIQKPEAIYQHFESRSPSHWIDLQLVEASAVPNWYLSIRVALCNPMAALVALRQLFDCLLSVGEGTIIEPVSKNEITSITDDTWHIVDQGFQAKRNQFVQAFGEFAAPISGEQVMEYIRMRRNHSGK